MPDEPVFQQVSTELTLDHLRRLRDRFLNENWAFLRAARRRLPMIDFKPMNDDLEFYRDVERYKRQRTMVMPFNLSAQQLDVYERAFRMHVTDPAWIGVDIGDDRNAGWAGPAEAPISSNSRNRILRGVRAFSGGDTSRAPSGPRGGRDSSRRNSRYDY